MDHVKYLDALVAEKNSLDPSYYVHAVRLLTEGKIKCYTSAFFKAHF
jgi:hypothetical protein